MANAGVIAMGFGMASVFGLIVGVSSVWNGRMTRRELGGVIERGQRETQQLIRETQQQTQQLIRETQQQTQQLIRETQQLIKEEQAANRDLLLRLHETTARISAKLG